MYTHFKNMHNEDYDILKIKASRHHFRGYEIYTFSFINKRLYKIDYDRGNYEGGDISYGKDLEIVFQDTLKKVIDFAVELKLKVPDESLSSVEDSDKLFCVLYNISELIDAAVRIEELSNYKYIEPVKINPEYQKKFSENFNINNLPQSVIARYEKDVSSMYKYQFQKPLDKSEEKSV